MKRITLVALLFTAMANAQFSYGPKAGLVLTTIKADNSIGIEPKSAVSYAIGAFSEYKFSDFSVNLGVSYGVYGSEGKTIGEDSFDFDIKEKMVVIDLTANYYITESLSIGAGGYYGAITDVEYVFGDSYKVDMTKEYENSDYGVVFKANYALYKGFFAEAQYNLGLASVFEKEKGIFQIIGAPKHYDTIENRFLTLSVGYRFK